MKKETKSRGDGLLAEWLKTQDKRQLIEKDRGLLQKNYSTNVKQETDSIRGRIAGIKIARAKEEEEKRKALIEAAAATKKAQAEKASKETKSILKPDAVKVKPPVREAEPVPERESQTGYIPMAQIQSRQASAPQPASALGEEGIKPYEQDPGDYEKPPTSGRAQGIIEEARRIMDSVKKIEALDDPESKKRRGELRMTVHRRVGQVANAGSQVFLVIKDFLELANNVWKNEGGDMLNYFAHVMAVKFIEMAEKQISLHPPSAFPYGQVVADLIGNIPAFKLILMAHLFMKCPYIVPRYPPRLEGQSDHEYKLTLGYKEIAPGRTEDESTYTERMCGIVSFYAAIVQSTPLRPNSVNPYDVKFGWIWVASILNMHPRPITPYVVAAFFDIAGYSMHKAYGINFLSIMEFLHNTFLPMVPSVSIAAKTRLKIFVEDALEHGGVKEPEGHNIEGINYDLIEQQRRVVAAKAAGLPPPPPLAPAAAKPVPPTNTKQQQPPRFKKR